MIPPSNIESPATYCGFVAVIGATNAGKSTLINQLVGQKVSIVSRKIQTTRSRILGLIQEPNYQIILVDTPGIFRAKSRLERAMVDTAWRSVGDSGLAAHVVDCLVGNGEYQQKISHFLQHHAVPALLVLNKIDMIDKPKLLDLIQAFQDSGAYKDILLVSALRGDGIDKLKQKLRHSMPPSPFLYDQDQVSDLPMRLLACEIVREHLFDQLHQELPYGLTVNPEQWQERRDGSLSISLCVHVQKSGHKGIIIGKGGQTLRRIGQRARHQIAELFEVPTVHLQLYVKISPRWQDDISQYQLWGLDFHAR